MKTQKTIGESKMDLKVQNSVNKTSLESIKKSNAAMRDELNAEMRLSALTNAQTGSKIAKLQEKGTFYAKQIEVEARKLNELETQIGMIQAAINEKRARLKKVEGNSSDNLTKDIKKLERTLDKVLQKHNEILAQNRQLKEEIDHLRRERVTFDKIYKRLEGELQDKQKDLCKVYDDAEKAKERKEKIEEQIKNLKNKVMKEESNIEREFQDIFKDINEKNVVDRIEEKFGSLQERTASKKYDSPMKQTNNFMLEDSHGDGDISRASIRKGARGGEKRPRETSGKTQEEVEEYNAIFESLKKKTNKNDLNEILTLFEDYETKNYSLYQHLTHLSDEKEGLDKQIQQIREEIDRLTQKQEKDVASGDIGDGKAQKIQELKKHIEDSDTRFSRLETDQKDLSATINELKISIPIIFERIGCNVEDYANELLDGATVNEGNMLQYLAIIEKKTNEILQMYHFSHNNKTDNTIKNTNIQGKMNEEGNVSGSTMIPPEINQVFSELVPQNTIEGKMKESEIYDFAKKKVEGVMSSKKSSKTAAKP